MTRFPSAWRELRVARDASPGYGRRSIRGWLLPLPLVAVVTATMFVVASSELLTGAVPAWSSVLACVAAALLYAVSHFARATRLAVIAMPFLGISFRSALALHLFVAPWSLCLPLKLDEAIRLHELCRVGGSGSRAIATLLIDRSMDGVVLLGLAGYLYGAGYGQLAGFTGLVGFALTLTALGFLILPQLLETVQRHLFIFNHGPNALTVLKTVSGLRELLVISRQTIRSTAPFLLLTTVGIWALELLAIRCLLGPPSRDGLGLTIETTLGRADQSLRLLLGYDGRLVETVATWTFLGALLCLWFPAAVIYLRRQQIEPRRPRLPASTGFTALRTGGRS